METDGDSLTPAAHTNDGFFKAIFSQPEHATAFFKSHLPPAIAAKVDWPSLVLIPSSFVKSSLQQVQTKCLSYCMDWATRDISTRGLDGDLSKATEQPHLPD